MFCCRCFFALFWHRQHEIHHQQRFLRPEFLKLFIRSPADLFRILSLCFAEAPTAPISTFSLTSDWFGGDRGPLWLVFCLFRICSQVRRLRAAPCWLRYPYRLGHCRRLWSSRTFCPSDSTAPIRSASFPTSIRWVEHLTLKKNVYKILLPIYFKIPFEIIMKDLLLNIFSPCITTRCGVNHLDIFQQSYQ